MPLHSYAVRPAGLVAIVLLCHNLVDFDHATPTLTLLNPLICQISFYVLLTAVHSHVSMFPSTFAESINKICYVYCALELLCRAPCRFAAALFDIIGATTRGDFDYQTTSRADLEDFETQK